MSPGSRDPRPQWRFDWRGPLGWFAASLALRLVLWMLVAGADVRPLFDEGAYYRRGLAFADLVRALFGGAADPGAAAALYDGGTWPPLQPMVLGLAFLALGPGLAVARLAMALVSAATTPLVFAVTARVSSRRAGRWAAALHALTPSFLAFSHYLWAETVYVALLFAALGVATLAADARSGTARTGLGAVLGGLLGFALLARAAAAPYLAFLPVWLAWSGRRRRGGIASAVAALGVALALVLPWQQAIVRHEGRWLWLSTSAGYNLWLGNNPWVPEAHGSSWSDSESGARLLGTLNERVEATGEPRDVAARRLALEEIASHPGRSLGRALDRARLLGSADAFLARHVLEVVYPPLPPWLAAGLLAASLAAQLAIVTLAVFGFALPRPALARRGLLLGLLALGALPPLLTISVSRMALPLLALLLPAAGHGAAWLGARGVPRVRAALPMAAGAVVAFAAFSSLPVVLRTHATPSGYYAGLVRHLERGLGTPLGCADKVVLRAGAELVGRDVSLSLSRGWRFLAIDDSEEAARYPTGFRRKVVEWTPRRAGELLVIDAFGRADAPARLTVQLGSGPPAEVPLVDPAAWRRYRPSGVPGLELAWQGAGASAPIPTGS